MKELPYFKFYTNEWITGDITFLDYETQGLFINLCAYYWSKDANLTLTNARRKFKDVKDESFDLLIETDIIKMNEDNIIIKFLDEQRGERGKLSTTNSLNGAKGGRPKKQTESENKPNALILKSETKAKKSNIEEKRREEKKKQIDVDAFLIWFNDMKLKHKGVEGKFKTLNTTDTNNLLKLKQLKYSAEDWEHAFKMMLANDWVKDNGTDTPSHFLVNNNFTRYLNKDSSTIKPEYKSPHQKEYEHIMKEVNAENERQRLLNLENDTN